MPYNGSGMFVRIYNFINDAAANIKIRADRMDGELDGIATGLSTAITKNGTTTIVANLPMATYRHTGVGAAVNRTDYARTAEVQDGSINWVDGGGTADAITASYGIPLTALVDGQLCYVRATAANATTTPTFAPSGLTARTIVKNGGVALVAGDIAGDGHELILRYLLASTRWELLNPAGFATLAGNNTLAGTTTLTGVVTVNGTSATSAAVRLSEDTDNGTNYIGLQAPASVSTNVTFVVPGADGTAGQYLKTDGTGNLGFVTDPFIAGLKDRVLNGLIISNNGSDATNDIDVSAGSCVSDDGTTVMTISSAMGKQLDNPWAVGGTPGTPLGGLDTGSIADTTYHVWVIHRTDTGVTDVVFSTSASSPTMPSNYTKKKCIGSIIRSSAEILPFFQIMNIFTLKSRSLDFNSGTLNTSGVAITLKLPSGVKTMGLFAASLNGSSTIHVAFTAEDETNTAAGTDFNDLICSTTVGQTNINFERKTNESSQIRYRASGNSTLKVWTRGWKDPRI